MTDLKLGNARFPSQYNQSHFTFISDENGINNRYAGFFKTERAGLFKAIREEFAATLSEEDQKANNFLIKKYFHDV